MADNPIPPINHPVADKDGRPTAEFIRYVKALEAKIKELETRLAALE